MSSICSLHGKFRLNPSATVFLSACAGAILPVLLLSCGPAVPDVAVTTVQDVTEAGNSVNDASASIDESGGSTGNLSLREVEKATYARLAPQEFSHPWYESVGVSRAEAAICSGTTFSACTANVIVRNFGGCTIGDGTFTGTVTITWGGASAACHPTAAGDTITRVPAFQITGPNGGTYTVSKTGTIGQRIQLTDFAATAVRVHTFNNDGIRRVIKRADGTVLYDMTQSTVSPITIRGTSRSGRSINGGTLRVLNNLTGSNCDYSPSNVTWAAGCNCPVSGIWNGTCSDGRVSTLTMTTCGYATVTLGSASENVHLQGCL